MPYISRYRLRRARKSMRRYRRGYTAMANLRKALETAPLQLPMVGARGTPASIDRYGANWAAASAAQRANRQQVGFYGRGAYFSPNASIASGLRSGGEWLGNLTGIPGAGEAARWGAGRFSKWLGFGAYENANQIAGGPEDQIAIAVNPMDPEGDIYMSHTEYLGNVTVNGTAGTSSAFQFVKYELNPGISSSFPFLSQIAQNFKLYEFQGLMFQYKPNSGEGSANQLGKIVMCTQYDTSAPDYLNTMEMQNYDYAQSSKPSLGMVHGVETKNSQQVVNMSYIRSGSTTRDKALTDVGTFYLATEGIPMGTSTSLVLGELWVSYRVKLSRASLAAQIGSNLPFYWSASSSTNVSIMAGSTVKSSASNLDLTLTNVSTTSFKITFPTSICNGTFLIQVTWVDAGGTFTTQQFNQAVIAFNCTQQYAAGAPSTAGYFQAPRNLVGATSNTSITGVYIVQVNAPDRSQASVQITASAARINSGAIHVLCHQINPSLVLA